MITERMGSNGDSKEIIVLQPDTTTTIGAELPTGEWDTKTTMIIGDQWIKDGIEI